MKKREDHQLKMLYLNFSLKSSLIAIDVQGCTNAAQAWTPKSDHGTVTLRAWMQVLMICREQKS